MPYLSYRGICWDETVLTDATVGSSFSNYCDSISLMMTQRSDLRSPVATIAKMSQELPKETPGPTVTTDRWF